jgi:dienelactone hydrolase
MVMEVGLTALPDFSEEWNGQTLHWEKAQFTDSEVVGSTGIPFGLALPAGYSPGGGQQYPLVIYLHGADARGNNDNKNLLRQTARFFAHQALTVPAFNAFVLSPQVPTGQQFVNVDFDHGPYEQSTNTLTISMQLTENLIRYLTDPAHEATLTSILGLSAADVDTTRLYVVGDSMGGYGTWDMLGRGALTYAAAIAAAGSGPSNRLIPIQETPLWVIHGEVDAVVPNYLPYLGDPDGAGSLGMLGLIDFAFDNSTSTALIRLDNYAATTDDPTPADTLIYSQYPGQFDHAAVATYWTASMASDFSSWLFGHSTEAAPDLQLATAVRPPRLEMVLDSNGGGWQLIWPETTWVLQEATGIDAPWTDVSPAVSSPYLVAMGGDSRFFRLREADAE